MGLSPEDAKQSQPTPSLLPGLTNLHLSPQIHLRSPPCFEPQWNPAPDQAGHSPCSPRSLGAFGGWESHPQMLPPLPRLQLSALPAGPEAPRTNGKTKTKSARGEGPGWRGERGSLCPCVSPAVAQPVPWPSAALSAGPAASPRPGARTAAAPAAPTAPRSPPTTAALNPPAGRDTPGP